MVPESLVDVYDFKEFKRTDVSGATLVVCLADMTSCPSHVSARKYIKSLRQAETAPIVPPVALQELIVDKSKYYRVLADAGIPVARTMHVRISDLLTNEKASHTAARLVMRWIFLCEWPPKR